MWNGWKLPSSYSVPNCSRVFSLGVAVKAKKDLDDGSGDAVVLIQRDHPSYSAAFAQHALGEKIAVPQNVQEVLASFDLKRPLAKTKEDLVKVLEQIQ